MAMMVMGSPTLMAQGQVASRYAKNIEKAKQGDASAQYQVGYSYRTGDGVAKDDSQVFYWYKKAADQGYAIAQFGLGVCYHDAVGVTKDYTQAVYWYRKAAEQGQASAQLNLGAALLMGEGVAQDKPQAIYWYKKSAEQGNKYAQKNLAVCYTKGEGVAKDFTQAIYWYRKAADQGLASAQYGLANRYYNGEGVQQDYAQAVYWYRKAADQGLADAKTWQAKAEEKLKEQNLAANKGQAQTTVAQTTPAVKPATPIATQPKVTPTQPKATTPATVSDVDKNIPSTSHVNENLFAVVIGNEHYQNETEVPFACNDAEVFARYCTRTLGVPEKQLKVYKDATYNNLRMAVNWLKTALDVSGGKGRAIFYYAGHGIPDESQQSAYMLPVDGMGNDPGSAYPLEKLYSELSSVASQNVTVFLDACFSGAKREGGMLASARGVAIKVKHSAPQGNLIIFSASQGDETAYPYKAQQHGMFTYYLLRKMQEKKGDVPLEELANYVRDAVRKQSFVENSKVQTPTVTPSAGLGTKWKNLKLK